MPQLPVYAGLDTDNASPYNNPMRDIIHQVSADPLLVGALVLAVVINLGVLGLKWERKRKCSEALEAR